MIIRIIMGVAVRSHRLLVAIHHAFLVTLSIPAFFFGKIPSEMLNFFLFKIL